MTVDRTARPLRDRVRTLADTVLYEGYLLYPYRADSQKNRSRWQFGVLGPVGAAESGLGEDMSLAAQCLIADGDAATVTLTVRFLQQQRRTVHTTDGTPVAELRCGDRCWISWDEAVEHELYFGSIPLRDSSFPLHVPAGSEVDELPDAGYLVRSRQPLDGMLEISADRVDGYHRLTVTVRNTGAPALDRADATARSFLGAHVVAELAGAQFVSLLEPPPAAAAATGRCAQHRCFPVLAGPAGDRSLLLISPIILYDHPEVAEQSDISLFDCTEIDEILALRIMTLTDEEKQQARATDPRGAEIIDHCDALTADQLQRLHGVLRDPEGAHRLDPGPDSVDTQPLPDGRDAAHYWDPRAEAAVSPETDAVVVDGVPVRKGSRVRLRPTRRADAQDLFYAGCAARVASVHQDFDGRVHIAVVVDDDPAADMHEWYGRYLYFAPEEIEPLGGPPE
ncbi:hypothetical protein [Nocardia sp. alder85J]|uniref:hypothetical protein n=1 Tax=Nocardia sp. alder85J TaxID=2862949 RepID=UPI001CD5AE43|nr:hypothetical protein [Nocardia sp. alder85J]MCX4098102.1 hypothetical protein [Nocardia sp. alder85J]